MELLRRTYTIFKSQLAALEKSSRPFSSVPNDHPSSQPANPHAAHKSATALPEAVRQDLELFEITPPGSLEEVKQKRKALLKKYHPDRFSREAHRKAIEQRQTAKEITQLYNEIYERLVEYFSKNTEK